jgi:hypothetical protein
MYKLIMKVRDGEDRRFNGALMASVAALVLKLALSARRNTDDRESPVELPLPRRGYSDLAREFAVDDAIQNYIWDDVARFAANAGYWAEHDQPVTNARLAAALSALSYVSKKIAGFDDEIAKVRAAVEAALRAEILPQQEV